MKRLLLAFAMAVYSFSVFAQAIHIFHDGLQTPDVLPNETIDSIYFAPKFLGSIEYQQVFVTKNSVKKYDVVDSVKFNLPHMTATLHSFFVPRDEVCVNIPSYAICKVVDEDVRISLFPSGNSNWEVDWSAFWEGDLDSSGEYRALTKQFKIITHDEPNVHTEKWYLECGGIRDSILLNFTGIPISTNRCNEVGFSGDEVNYVFDTNFPTEIELWFLNHERNLDGVDIYYNEDGKPVLHFPYNDTGTQKLAQARMYINGYCHKDVLYKQGVPFLHSSEEHMAALRDFCDSTDFETWGKNTNWWSDQPLWEWDYCVNHSNWTWLIDDHIVSLYFGGGQYTGVHGTIPASFEVILDDLQADLDFGCCALYGVIPYNVRHSRNWQKYGWNFIVQEPWYGGGFDMEDINLRMDNEDIMYANGTKSTAYEELAKHKLTLISIGAPSIGMQNLCLSYANKGFEYIYAAQDWMGGTLEEALNSARELEKIPNVLVCYNSWSNGSLNYGLSAIGSTFLLDSLGNVIDFAAMDFGIDEDFYSNRLAQHLLKHLGEPEEYDPVDPTLIYTSSDYSHDGEVMTLQKATIGRGIDLVFMGDQYVDTLLVEGGKYEEDMRAAMEYFFDVEPYKTLRERFNVYVVKAVSPNGNEGSVHKFDFNNDLVFEYAQKISDVHMDNVAITVIHNAQNSFSAIGETGMWESGASIAWIEQGGPSEIICHETGGHGFAKLLDEYIYGGYEDYHTQEGANEDFREWIKTSYHDRGWGMNISATDNPDEVPWSHFLKDERYKNEVGIYKGAWFWPEELWRPSENSIMKETSYLWFNAPSREAIYKRVMQLSEGENWAYDYETFVAFDAPIREVNKQAQAKARAQGMNSQDMDKRRIELRPPTIHKGSWRNAGKSSKSDCLPNGEKFINARKGGTSVKKVSTKGITRPYYMYKGEQMSPADFNRKWKRS